MGHKLGYIEYENRMTPEKRLTFYLIAVWLTEINCDIRILNNPDLLLASPEGVGIDS